MIIDLILDRIDGKVYEVNEFYDQVSKYANDLSDYTIPNAFGIGSEEEIKTALCDYVIGYGYRDKITDYINSVNWLS